MSKMKKQDTTTTSGSAPYTNIPAMSLGQRNVMNEPDGIVGEVETLAEYGDTGLKRYSGIVREEFLAQLDGLQGIRLITEMRDNHPIIGAINTLVRNLVGQVTWSVEPAHEAPEEREKADFVQSCLDDMEQSWHDVISEILSFTDFGWSYHEIVYKKREGPDAKEPKFRSRYSDGRIGWRKLPIRAQETLLRFHMDDSGSVLGMVQQVQVPTNQGPIRFIPIEKALHFRTTSFKNNPLGKSIYRNAAVPYMRQRRIEEAQCIGIERDLVGYPIIYVPSEIMSQKATNIQRQTFINMRNAVRNMRRDESEGLVLPSDVFDGTSIAKYRAELMTSGGQRTFNITEIVNRYDQRIAMTALADFIMLGHTQVGTFSLASTKTNLFAVALASYLKVVCEQFNRFAIPRLLKLNGYSIDTTPILKHGDIEDIDITEVASMVSALAGAGMPLFPDTALEDHLRQRLGWPAAGTGDVRSIDGSGNDMEGDKAALTADYENQMRTEDADPEAEA